MTHLDLFSGIGGFALAARWAGITTIGFCETDEYCSKILRKHWPDVPNHGDIRGLLGGRCDLITAGVPCQPASCAGQRRGPEDDRWLWPEALRVLGESMPTWAIFENPPGILSLNGGMEFERVLSQMEGLGYTIQPIVVPACAVDARHRRSRVWIVGYSQSRRTWTEEQPGQRNGPQCRSEDVANAQCVRRRESTGDTSSEREPFRAAERKEGSLGPGSGSEALAHSLSPGLEERQEQPAWEEREAAKRDGNDVANPPCKCLNWAGDTRQGWRDESPNSCEWLPEPQLGRVANGIPNRVDRLRGLGNAIVPQVAYQIMKHFV